MGDTLKDPLLIEDQARRGAIAKRIFSAVGTRNYARQKTLARYNKENEDEQPSLLSRAFAPLRYAWERFKLELNYATLPLKSGLSAALCSILCFLPGYFSFLNKNGMWAVVTADVVLEANVGLTFSKGVNRTLGTLAAAALALLVNYVAPKCGAFEPYFVVFFVFFGGVFATMFKFRRPFKDRWNYAVAMSMITFHILILSKSEYSEKLKLPMIRLVDIMIGFLIACLVNLSVVPTYAGSTINELVAKNFERAGNVMERCVFAYCEGTVLEQVPEILAGKSEDDNIHASFHEIVSSDSEVDKLLKAVPFEPCHGKFFFGYPWDLYEDIKENLRYTLYDVVALDSCLRAEIQAPLHLRHIFRDEFECIGKECAQVFRLIGESIRTMRHVRFRGPMQQAEEGALLLQHKIAKYTSSLIGGESMTDPGPDQDEPKDVREEKPGSYFDEVYADLGLGDADSYFSSDSPSHVERSDSTKSNDTVKTKAKTRMTEGHEEFIQRQESMGRHWDTTVQRISALSLIKFASLLIELLAKAKYVVTIVDELEIKARFEEEEQVNSLASTPGYHGV